MSDLWLRYNNDVADLLFKGGYHQGAFSDDLAALKTAYTALAFADNGFGVIRGQGTVLEEQIYAVLKAYRQRIPAEFAKGSALYNTLPRHEFSLPRKLRSMALHHDFAPGVPTGIWQ